MTTETSHPNPTLQPDPTILKLRDPRFWIALKHLGLNQKQFAALLGYSPRHLQAIIAGQRHPSPRFKTCLNLAIQKIKQKNSPGKSDKSD